MNIVNCSPETAVALSELLGQILALVWHEPLTIESLNTKTLFPASDGDVLVSGQCQLAPGSLLFIDEIKLDEGSLQDRGMVQFPESITKSQVSAMFTIFQISS